MKTITVIAKEWFDKINGNSYFSAKCYVDNKQVLILPYQYGYGEHYIDIAKQELEKAGIIKGVIHHANGSSEALWQYCLRKEIRLLTTKQENCRKKDLDH